MPTPALPQTLSPESSVDFLVAPVNLHFSTIYILIDRNHPLADLHIRLLALLEHLEYQVTTNRWIVCVAKVLVDPLLEGFDSFAQLLGVVRMDELLEDGARV
jgi:hypothetical protein